MSFFKNKLVKTVLVIILVTVVVAIASKLTGGKIENAGNSIIASGFGVVSKVTNPVTKFFSNAFSAGELEKENNRLKEENNKLKIENRSIEEYTKENDRLKSLLGLKNELANVQTVSAQITALDFDNMSGTIMINRGSNDGVKIDDCVICNSGIVGKVCDVGKNWAKVMTILSPNNSIGARVSRTGDVGICEGDVSVKKNGNIRLSYVNSVAEVIEGDIIESTGTGGIYPGGFVIGNVEIIQKDNAGKIAEILVKPAVDFSNLYEVLVVTNWEVASIRTDNIDTKEEE